MTQLHTGTALRLTFCVGLRCRLLAAADLGPATSVDRVLCSFDPPDAESRFESTQKELRDTDDADDQDMMWDSGGLWPWPVRPRRWTEAADCCVGGASRSRCMCCCMQVPSLTPPPWPAAIARRRCHHIRWCRGNPPTRRRRHSGGGTRRESEGDHQLAGERSPQVQLLLLLLLPGCPCCFRGCRTCSRGRCRYAQAPRRRSAGTR